MKLYEVRVRMEREIEVCIVATSEEEARRKAEAVADDEADLWEAPDWWAAGARELDPENEPPEMWMGEQPYLACPVPEGREEWSVEEWLEANPLPPTDLELEEAGQLNALTRR